MSTLTERHALIGVGGNLGTKAELLARFLAAERALRARLEPRVRAVHTRWSPFYRSAPQGPVRAQPEFLNAVLAVEAGAPLEPRALLSELLAVEAGLGRTRSPRLAQGPRTIDLDLLFVGDVRSERDGSPALCLPHPRVAERAFVLLPLADLMGRAWPMPGFARTVADCLRDPDVARQVPTVTRIDAPGSFAPRRPAVSPRRRAPLSGGLRS